MEFLPELQLQIYPRGSQWLTSYQPDSQVDLGEGLRQNFDPKAKWKTAIFKVQIANSINKMKRAVPVKDGRTTSDEEESDSDDASIITRPKSNSSIPKAANGTPASPPKQGGRSNAMGRTISDPGKVKETAKATQSNQQQASGVEDSQANPASGHQRQPSQSHPASPTTTRRPTAKPHQHAAHGPDSDSDVDEPGTGYRSMPGSFNFGWSKHEEGQPQEEVTESFLSRLKNLGWS